MPRSTVQGNGLGGARGAEERGEPSSRRDGERPTVYLHPGRLVACAEPTAVMTILGSCVAVCLWDPAAAAGGVCHFVLPYGRGSGRSALRFGNVAITELAQHLLGVGCKPRRLKAKLFGGARVIAPLRRSGGHLGLNNVEVARTILSASRIPIMAEDVGGHRGRKLIFHPDDGEAWVKAV